MTGFARIVLSVSTNALKDHPAARTLAVPLGRRPIRALESEPIFRRGHVQAWQCPAREYAVAVAAQQPLWETQRAFRRSTSHHRILGHRTHRQFHGKQAVDTPRQSLKLSWSPPQLQHEISHLLHNLRIQSTIATSCAGN